MKSISIFIVSLTIFLAVSCTEETPVIPKEYPYVITNVPVVHSEGANLSGNLLSSGKQNIIRYGFVWSERDKPRLTDDHKFFEGNLAKSEYSFDLKSALENGKTYMVRAYVQTENFEIFGNTVPFKSQGSLPPVIRSVTPEYGPIGTQVTIHGENFSNSLIGNKVQIGSITATIVSVSETVLKVSIPKIVKPETGKIQVTVAGMTATSGKSFDMWFPWLRKTDFPGKYTSDASSFAIGDNIYLLGGASTTGDPQENAFWEYNTKTDTWNRKPNYPGQYRNQAITFTCNGKGYFGMGEGFKAKYLTDIWEYDPSTEQWSQKTNFPGTPVIYAKAMVINNKAYMGPGKYWADSWSDFVSDFWEYDPVLDLWTRKSNFPGNERQGYIAIGTNTKGYLGSGGNGFSQNEIYEYDPESDKWQAAETYPGEGTYDLASFCINNKIYVGLGQTTSNDACSDFWEFNPTDRSWKKLHSSPTTLTPAISHNVNNKGYVGYGWIGNYTYGTQPKGKMLLEFDPTKN